VTGEVWTLNPSDGELIVRTGVTGRAARMGHRLTIAMRQWQATVNWADGKPTDAKLTVEVDSLEVLHGEGGVKGLSGPEKVLVRSNALRALDAGHFPRICFDAETVQQTDSGYRLIGRLQIHGKTRKHEIDLRTDDLGGSWRLSTQARVCQSDFGIKPYSLLMGSVKVADEVTVSFSASRAKDH
jgi:polyisoprenoid-binding protein YceI